MSRPSFEELARFNRGLAEMVRSGVPLPDAVRQLGKEAESRALRGILEEVEKATRDGADLLKALEPHRAQLPELWLRMVEAGVQSGSLADVLENFSRYAEGRLALQRRVRESLAYPALTLAFIVPLLLLLVVAVGPALVEMAEKGPLSTTESLNARQGLRHTWKEIPNPTVGWGDWTGVILGPLKAAISSVDAIRANPLPSALAAVVLLLVSRRLARRLGSSVRWRALTDRLPLVGPVRRLGALGLVLRTLETLVRCGLPIPKALELAAVGVDHPGASRSLLALARRTNDGLALSAAMQDELFFPPYVAWILSKEEGGPQFAAALSDIADHYLAATERRAENLRLLIFPIAEVLLGLIVFMASVTFVIPWLLGPMVFLVH